LNPTHTFRKIFTSLLFFLSLAEANTQSTTFHQGLYWARYYLRWEINRSTTLHAEVDNRRFMVPEGAQHQFIGHLHGHKKVREAWEGWLGVSVSSISAQRPDVAISTPSLEYRAWQAVSFQHKMVQLIMLHRLRWEERFVRRTPQAGARADIRFAFRARYAASVQKALGHHVRLKLGDEVMLQWGKGLAQAFDQNRVWGAMDLSWADERWNVELQYIWLWQQAASGDIFYDRDIARVTLLHRIKSKG
jgi:Protein of unknown function (DUF2490)